MLKDCTMEYKDNSLGVKLSEYHTIKTEDGGEEIKMSENAEDVSKKEPNKHKRRFSTMIDEDPIQIQEKIYKNFILSLTKPSYLLRPGLGSKGLRWENRNRLHYLLRKLVRQHNWVDASGVLSVLLKGTSKEKCPVANRFKHSVSMELLNHVESYDINPTRIKNVYDIWMKRIGSLKDSPVQEKIVISFEFIIFCLARGAVEEANLAAVSLNEKHPMSNMLIALTFYELWRSSIPREMQWEKLDQIYSPMRSDFSGERFNHHGGNSEGHDTVYSYEAETDFRDDSDTSVMIGKTISMEINNLCRKVAIDDQVKLRRQNPVQNIKPFNFYVNSSENEASLSNDGGPMNLAPVYVALEGVDSWLLPIKLPKSEEDYENFTKNHKNLFNDKYKKAVKYLRLALYSTPPVLAALLPFIQDPIINIATFNRGPESTVQSYEVMFEFIEEAKLFDLLLIGGHVDEALKELNKFCHNSLTEFPLRLRSSLLHCFDCNNYGMLSTCFEEILKKDPTCRHSLARLISMHQNGNYRMDSLLEMIALHLDATYADYSVWREFALCFLKVSQYEEDRMSVCLNGNEGEKKQGFSVRYNRIPNILTEGKSGKNWMFRCRWWLNRHFSKKVLASDIAAGDLQLLTYKAACASHMYGQEFLYVVKACTSLQKENERDLFMLLQMHMQNSIRLYTK